MSYTAASHQGAIQMIGFTFRSCVVHRYSQTAVLSKLNGQNVENVPTPMTCDRKVQILPESVEEGLKLGGGLSRLCVFKVFIIFIHIVMSTGRRPPPPPPPQQRVSCCRPSQP